MATTTIGTSAATVTVDRAARRMAAVGSNWHRQLVTLAITGHDSVPEQLVLVGYTRSGVLAVIAPRTDAAFSGTSAAASVTLDLNTTELQTMFTGVSHGLMRSINLRLWSVSTLELLATGTLEILSTGLTYTADTGATPVPPISGTTVIWGKLALYGGLTYVKNATDGLWYPFDLSGAGAAVTEHIDETGGITIPGG